MIYKSFFFLHCSFKKVREDWSVKIHFASVTNSAFKIENCRFITSFLIIHKRFFFLTSQLKKNVIFHRIWYCWYHNLNLPGAPEDGTTNFSIHLLFRQNDISEGYYWFWRILWLHKISDICDFCKPRMNADAPALWPPAQAVSICLRSSAFICGSYRKPQKPLESGIQLNCSNCSLDREWIC